MTLRHKTSDPAVRDCWNAAISRIRETLPAREYRTWFAPTRFLGSDDGAIRILVPNRTFVAKLENGYGALLRETLSQCGAPSTAIRFRISGTPVLATSDAAGAEPQAHPITPEHTDSILREPGPGLIGNGRLAENQTFESFVVGESNRFAFDAARSVSNPGIEYSPYNPLVIYGQTGLGKTHLLNAIRLRVREHSPELRVLALKGEAFTRQVVSAALSSRLFELREWYSGVDVFLVDDIQFISGLGTFGRSTQEFLHALDALAERGRQTVLTLDCHPGEIPNLDGRLRSRMESGLAHRPAAARAGHPPDHRPPEGGRRRRRPAGRDRREDRVFGDRVRLRTRRRGETHRRHRADRGRRVLHPARGEPARRAPRRPEEARPDRRHHRRHRGRIRRPRRSGSWASSASGTWSPPGRWRCSSPGKSPSTA